jgi:hypothetical protein
MSRRYWCLLIATSAAIALACGGGGSSGSGFPEPDAGSDAEVEPDAGDGFVATTLDEPPLGRYLRVTVTQESEDGAFQVEVGTTEGRGARPAVAGSHLVVVRSAGEVVGVSFVSLDSEIRFEGTDELPVVAEAARGVGTVYVDTATAADTVEILAVDGAIVASVEVEVPAWSGPVEQGLRTARRPLATDVASLSAAYPHIHFITNRADISALFVLSLGSIDPFVGVSAPDPTQAANLDRALAGLAPNLRGSIASIAFAEFSEDHRGTYASVTANHMALNTVGAYPGETDTFDPTQDGDFLQGLLGHESSHCFQHLSAGNFGVDESRIPQDVAAAIAVFRRLYYRTPLVDATWGRAHSTALAIPGTRVRDYGALGGDISFDDVLFGGFASAGGAGQYIEDFAGYVGLFYAPTQGPVEAELCRRLREAGERGEFPAELALNFTKLLLVRHYDLIDDAQLHRCIGDVDPATGDGFVLGGLNFSDGLQAGVADGHTPDYYRLLILGNSVDSPFQALIQIPIPTEFPAVGLHSFDALANEKFSLLSYPNEAISMLVVADPALPPLEALAESVISTGGFAVVTRADNTGVSGYVFYVTYPLVSGLPDTNLGWFHLDY